MAQPPPPKKVGRGTPFDPTSTQLSVLSYNLLAPLYVRTLDTRTGEVQPWAAFEWSEPAEEVLVWGARQPKLLAELQRSAADVICLQEVQFEECTAATTAAEEVSGGGGGGDTVAPVDATAPVAAWVPAAGSTGGRKKGKGKKGLAEKEYKLPAWLTTGMAGYDFVLPGASKLAAIAARNGRVLKSPTPIGNAIL
jgi:hypothetical protein